jgi:hypothetical protein
MSVLRVLRHAGTGPEPLGNFRWLMTLFWILEDTLGRITGVGPFPRGRPRPERVVDASWLGAPGAATRVRYVLDRADGVRALPALAATRGVLQGDEHHLDVLDHSLLTLAYAEAILADPAGALRNPASLDARLHLPWREPLPPLDGPAGTLPARAEAEAGKLAGPLAAYLGGETALAFKWAALLHDVGKAVVRTVERDARPGRVRIQFPGHEAHGARLVTEELHSLFPAEGAAEMARLLATQAQARALLAVDAATARMLEPLRSTTQGGFPLAILLAYADRLASRGPAAAPRIEAAATAAITALAQHFGTR